MATKRGVEWSDDEKALLIELWNNKMSARKIGEKLGRTKNSVIGQTTRLGLTRKPKSTPAKMNASGRQIHSAEWEKRGRSDLCQWISGEPADADFCHKPVAKHHWPYCADHLKVVRGEPTKPLKF